MLNDLNRYFNLFGRIEKTKMQCWAVVRTNNADSGLETRSGKPQTFYDDSTGNQVYINQPFKKLVAALNAQNNLAVNKPIFLDETGIQFNIDIQLPRSAYTDREILKRSLAAYGLSLIEVTREIEMFILTETNQHQTN